jgi:hypothetical protein
MSRRRLLELLMIRWGFAALVAIAIAIGFVAAMSVAPPMDIPAVALQATIVYRLEVGAAVFVGLYLATMAFVLALRNRGFTEIGGGSVRAQDLSAVSGEEEVFMVAVADLADELQELRSRWEAIEDDR